MVDAGGSDAHWGNRYKWALRAAHMLAAYDVAWFEEPLHAAGVGYAALLRRAAPRLLGPGTAERLAAVQRHADQLAYRNRLARDLHDSVSQELFSLTMLAAAAQRLLDRNPTLAAAQLGEIQETAQRALQETRSLIFALRPAMLDDRGLGPALRDMVCAAHDRQGLRVDLAISGERRLPLDHEQALFRIVQEALANVVRHSGVRAAEVRLHYEDRYTYLEVRDGGRGFSPATPRNARSIGLDSMAERAAALGGTFTVDSLPGQGTTVAVTLPGEPLRA